MNATVDPPETVYKAVERALDECSAWIARPDAECTKKVALAAGIAWSLHDPHGSQAVALWMIERGYATGHGDTLDQLLGELVMHVRDDFPYKEALHDLVQLRSEEFAIGGGPGFKDRLAKAWRAAEELFEP